MPRTLPDLPPQAASRRWSVGVVLAVALGLAFAVPLATRALGQDQPANFPGCGIAPWTGTCTCRLTPNGTAMDFPAFERAVRDPAVRPRVRNPEITLATARQECRMDRPPQAAQAR